MLVEQIWYVILDASDRLCWRVCYQNNQHGALSLE